MGELLERYAEQRAEQKRLDMLYYVIRNAMESFKVTMEEAMDGLKISESDQAALSKRF